ncbi:hypothetical protein ACH4E8_13310 [Streptomyces sp. NPDC017979]|uniref:hypothetical protein n=1 Tax=Streptomyces sp. NPDC017979 TaxID=3365024 RepID=UPI00378D7394
MRCATPLFALDGARAAATATAAADAFRKENEHGGSGGPASSPSANGGGEAAGISPRPGVGHFAPASRGFRAWIEG